MSTPAGNKQFGKWIFEPVGGAQSLSDDEAKAKGTDFLFDELRQRVAAGSVAFNFNLQLAQPGDKIDSAVVPLPEDRKKVTLGRLTITSVAADAAGPCVTITYNPMVLPKGVEPSPTRCSPPAPRRTPSPRSPPGGRREAAVAGAPTSGGRGLHMSPPR